MSATKRICLLAVLIATLTGGKTAIAFIPNVEIVTALFIVYALVFGWRNTVLVSIIFVLIEILIWGFMPWWVLLYFIYWPLLVTAVAFLPRKNTNLRLVLAIVTGIVFTVGFGVLSTFIEIIFMGGLETGLFWRFFYFRYIAGIPFFTAHIVSNAVILPKLIPVLYRTLKKLQPAFERGKKKRINTTGSIAEQKNAADSITVAD